MILIYKIQRGTINLKNNDLAQILMESKQQLKIFEEIAEVHSNPPLYCSIGHYGGSPIVCECMIEGPPLSPYHGKQIKVEITLYDGYPYIHPEFKILSNRFLHINCFNQLSGFTRLSHFHILWQSNWNITKILCHFLEILQNPRIDLLPVSFQSIANDWMVELEKRKKQPSGKGDGSKSEKEDETHLEGEKKNEGEVEKKKTLKYSKVEELSSEETMKKISKLNRLEQMHLQILFLYLTDYELFCYHIQRNYY
jgi:ubiquitin-protein ligase